MAKSGLKTSLVLEQAGVFLLTAATIKRLSGSRRRASSHKSEASVSEMLNEAISLQHSFRQFLHFKEQNDSETWPFALFYCATAISNLLFEIEHEMLALPNLDSRLLEIEKIYQLRLFWSRDPATALQKGVLDSWDIDQSIANCTQILSSFT